MKADITPACNSSAARVFSSGRVLARRRLGKPITPTPPSVNSESIIGIASRNKSFAAGFAGLLALGAALALSAAADETPATAKILQRALSNGSFARWSAPKRHAAEQAVMQRITDDPDAGEAGRLASQLKLAEHQAELVPSQQHPLVLTDPLQRLRYHVNHAIEMARAAEDPKYAAPASKNFPGAVAATVLRDPAAKVTIVPRTGRQGLWDEDETYFRLHSTGYYAPPGEEITVTVPAAWVGKAQVMIGVHRDGPAGSGDFDESGLHRDGFDLTTQTDITEVETRVSSPYGGPVFLCLPNIDQPEQPFTVTVGGAVRAPRFKAGVTSVDEWRKTLRYLPVPWAEIESDSLLISLPSARIRNLDDPKAVTDFWDEVLAADAELACIPKHRKVVEHMVVDIDIVSGYMVSTTDRVTVPDDDSCAMMLDVAKLRKEGSWGHFHELGHRHQFDALDFKGTEEVTVNLYTLYVYQKVLHLDPYAARHEDDWSQKAVAKNIKAYLAKPSFKTWQDDPFLALSFYMPILDEFGWKAILELHRGYRAIPPADYPTTDAGKRDLFYQHLSRATGRDLAGYFKRWAIPIRKSALLKPEAGLKPWLPADWK